MRDILALLAVLAVLAIPIWLSRSGRKVEEQFLSHRPDAVSGESGPGGVGAPAAQDPGTDYTERWAQALAADPAFTHKSFVSLAEAEERRAIHAKKMLDSGKHDPLTSPYASQYEDARQRHLAAKRAAELTEGETRRP